VGGALANQQLNGLAAGSSMESSASNARLWVGWVAWDATGWRYIPALDQAATFSELMP
jgi:hypothetical protein